MINKIYITMIVCLSLTACSGGGGSKSSDNTTIPTTPPTSINQAQARGILFGTYEDSTIENSYWRFVAINNDYIAVNSSFDVGPQVPISGKAIYTGRIAMLINNTVDADGTISLDVDFGAKTFNRETVLLNFNNPNILINMNGTFDNGIIKGEIGITHTDDSVYQNDLNRARLNRQIASTRCSLIPFNENARYDRCRDELPSLQIPEPVHPVNDYTAIISGLIGEKHIVGAFGSDKLSGGFQASPTR